MSNENDFVSTYHSVTVSGHGPDSDRRYFTIAESRCTLTSEPVYVVSVGNKGDSVSVEISRKELDSFISTVLSWSGRFALIE